MTRLARLLPLFCLAWSLPAAAEPSWQGYIEGEYRYLAASENARLVLLHVRRGEAVTVDQPLFELDPTEAQAALAEAEADLATAEHRLADLRRGERPEELAMREAELAAARAALAYAQAEHARMAKLVARKVENEASLDFAERELTRTRAEVARLEAALAVGRLAAREEAIAAQEATVEAAKAAVAEARWRLEELSVVAPAAGVIQDTLYYVGERPGAGQPVVILLPPEGRRLRFFVPEPAVAGLAVGQQVSLFCDGCDEALRASIDFIAPEVEFTPPVIYSKETRTKLVVRVEARLEGAADRLPPGLPVTVLPARP